MRVLIDAHMIGAREAGNESYMASLLEGLAQVNATDELIVAAADAEEVGSRIAGGRGFDVVPVSVSPWRRLFRELPALARRLGADLVYATYAGPLRTGCPLVLSVHDVSFRREPQWFSPRDRVVLNAGVGISVRRAAAIITLSDFSRREIEAFYPGAAGRIHVIPAAAARRFVPDGRGDAEIRARHGLRPPYVLAVGGLQPRKNLVRLVEAFGRLIRNGFSHDLVLVGSAGWHGGDAADAARKAGLSDRVRPVGYVEADDLPAIYRGADVFVYPSLYEGFGLPVIEAMACGTPVVASSTSSIPSVAAGAARLVDPRSVDALADALADACGPQAQRAHWRALGLARSRTFTWERTAADMLDVFRAVARAAHRAPSTPQTP